MHAMRRIAYQSDPGCHIAVGQGQTEGIGKAGTGKCDLAQSIAEPRPHNQQKLRIFQTDDGLGGGFILAPDNRGPVTR